MSALMVLGDNAPFSPLVRWAVYLEMVIYLKSFFIDHADPYQHMSMCLFLLNLIKLQIDRRRLKC